MAAKELREYMKRKHIEMCLFFNIGNENPDSNFFFLSEEKVNGVIVVTKKGRIYMISSVLDKPKKMKGISIVTSSGKSVWDTIKDISSSTCSIGIDKKSVSVALLESLKKNAKPRKIMDVSSAMEDLRKKKSKEEINKVKTACRITENIIKECIINFPKFRTEGDVVRFLKIRAIENRCGLAFEPVVASGNNAAIPHHVASEKKLQNGFCIIDFGVKYKGYCADISRTLFLGKPSKNDLLLFEKVKKAQEESIALLAPGQKIRKIALLAKKMLGKEFIHALGHGVGIDIHELPYIGEKSKGLLEEGNVITIEPGIYSKSSGKRRGYGIRLEDMLLITKDGKKLLSNPQKKMIIVKKLS